MPEQLLVALTLFGVLAGVVLLLSLLRALITLPYHARAIRRLLEELLVIERSRAIERAARRERNRPDRDRTPD